MAIDNKFPVRHWTWTTRAAGQQTDHRDDADGDGDGGDGDGEPKCMKMSDFLWYAAKPDYTMVVQVKPLSLVVSARWWGWWVHLCPFMSTWVHLGHLKWWLISHIYQSILDHIQLSNLDVGGPINQRYDPSFGSEIILLPVFLL